MSKSPDHSEIELSGETTVEDQSALTVTGYSWVFYSPSFWNYAIRGIALAGVLFPMVLGVLLLAEFDPSAATSAIIGLLLFCCSFGFIFFMGGTLVLGDVLRRFVLRLVQAGSLEGERIYLAIFVGGLTGYVGTSLVVFPLLLSGSTNDALLRVGYLICALATIMGQLGAAIGACWARIQLSDLAPHPTPGRAGFRIAHLLILMLIASLLLTILKMAELPIESVLLFSMGWFVLQSITLLLILGGALVALRV